MKASLSFRAIQSSAVANALASRTAIRVAVLGVIVGAAVLSNAAQAQETQPVRTKQAGAESLWLTVENPTQERMQLRVVQRSSNACLSTEINRQASYGCKLSFDKLPTGQYDLVLRVGQERYRYAVDVKTQAQHSTISVREMGKEAPAKVLATAAL